MPYPSEFKKDIFWDQIKHETSFILGWDRVNRIIHPCLRLAYRILFCLIFARWEVSQITKTELFFLWCMIREDDPRLKFSSYFFQKCFETRARPTGDIYFGGLITIIANGLNHCITSPPYSPLHDSSLLDIPCLINMFQISPHSPNCYYWATTESKNIVCFRSLLWMLSTFTIVTYGYPFETRLAIHPSPLPIPTPKTRAYP